jgi:hypothetical protein
MKNHRSLLLALSSAVLLSLDGAFADNPLILDQFCADPTARAFEGKIFLYPSHDILAPRGTWFRMADYHAYSSDNLLDWHDYGVIVSQDKVDWVNATSYSMWAPDCVTKNDKYYFYFPAQAGGGAGRGGAAARGGGIAAGTAIGGANPAASIQAAITDLTDDQKTELQAAATELNTKLQTWQTSSQATLQPLQPQFTFGQPADPAAQETYNAELAKQNLLRENLINDAEIAMVGILKSDQAVRWESTRLNQQVSTSIGTLGLTAAQKAKLDAMVAETARTLATTKDRAALVKARGAFWNQVSGMLNEIQITQVFAPTFPPARGTIGRGGAAGGGGGGGGGNRIGVAIADHPGGPYKPEPLPIQGIGGIDPCVLIDPKDGQAYIYVAQGRFSVAKLKPNMTELDSQPQVLDNFPTQGLIEGPFVFERNGIYYVTYPHAANVTERLEYAMAKSPTGPFTVTGVIMDESASGCWTNHHSLVEYNGQWMLFYHDKDLNPDNDRNRSARADYLTFNPDGTIQKVIPTLRGVGICDAKRHIQIDRYSAVSKTGTAVSFLDDAQRNLGWKIALSDKDAFVQYDRVDFGKDPLKAVNVRSNSSTGGTLEIHLDKPDGPVLAKVQIPKGADWATVNSKLASAPTGLHNLVVTIPEKNNIEIDWVSFE